MFNEKTTEYSAKQGREIPVWQSPKYEESRKLALEIINSKKYGLDEGDFWILMNETKSGKMAYTGLITSHNACLKINDKLENKFDPASVTLDKEGFGGSLVYTYCNAEQGLYEVGEVSNANCKNGYPYAMAFKRMYDRVVLKLSKLAYSGIYSEEEADDFRDPVNETTKKEPEQKKEESGSSLEQLKKMVPDFVNMALTSKTAKDNGWTKEEDFTPEFLNKCMKYYANHS